MTRRALFSSAAILAAALWIAFRHHLTARRRDRERLYARLDAVVARAPERRAA